MNLLHTGGKYQTESLPEGQPRKSPLPFTCGIFFVIELDNVFFERDVSVLDVSPPCGYKLFHLIR